VKCRSDYVCFFVSFFVVNCFSFSLFLLRFRFWRIKMNNWLVSFVSAVIASTADNSDVYSVLSPSSSLSSSSSNDIDVENIDNQRLASSASAFISKYILARLLGTSPAELIRNPGIPGLPTLPDLPFPVSPEAGAQPIEPGKDVDAVSNGLESTGNGEIGQTTVPVYRIPVQGHRQQRRGHRLGANKVEQTLMEWNGQRGKARSVSNAAANLVLFAPLSSRARPPEIDLPIPTSAPSGDSSLQAIVEKALSQGLEDGARVAKERSQENTARTEAGEFKSGPAKDDISSDQEEQIGFIAQSDQDYVTPVTGYHLRPRLFPAKHSNGGDGTGSVSLRLPPDNAPWTISEEPTKGQLPDKDDVTKPEVVGTRKSGDVAFLMQIGEGPRFAAPEYQLQTENDDDDDVIKPETDRRSNEEAIPNQFERSNFATTDPTVHMYTVLSGASRQLDVNGAVDDDVTDDVRDDARSDVKGDVTGNMRDDVNAKYDVIDDAEDDSVDVVNQDVEYYVSDDVSDGASYDVADEVGYDVSDDVNEDATNTVGNSGNDVTDGVGEDNGGRHGVSKISPEEEKKPEVERLQTAAVKDFRRLSPEFIRVLRSLWPGLDLCAGPECNEDEATSRPSVDPSVSNSKSPFVGVRQNTVPLELPEVTKLKFAVAGLKRGGVENGGGVGISMTTPIAGGASLMIDAGIVTPGTTPSSLQVRSFN